MMGPQGGQMMMGMQGAMQGVNAMQGNGGAMWGWCAQPMAGTWAPHPMQGGAMMVIGGPTQPQQQQQQQQQQNNAGPEMLSGPEFVAALASAAPQEQKQILGNKLYGKIAKFNPSLAGK